MEYLKGLSLGKEVEYSSKYAPDLLCPIERLGTRQNLGISPNALPFKGVDVWNAYELSWLNNNGLPQVACAQFIFPCESTAIIESKSFKLYLNSFNQSAFSDKGELLERLKADLSLRAGAEVKVKLFEPSEWQFEHDESMGDAFCIDHQDISIDVYQPDPALLSSDSSEPVDERLVSHLLRSLCPVTGQPDWACVFISYQGPKIDKEGLLRYIVGFREFQEFHEQCVERIFVDIMGRCKPQQLTVYARYLRRGGLDINPYRSTADINVVNRRLFRQ